MEVDVLQWQILGVNICSEEWIIDNILIPPDLEATGAAYSPVATSRLFSASLPTSDSDTLSKVRLLHLSQKFDCTAQLS